MIKSLAILVSAAMIGAAATQQPVVISGTATDCIDLEVIKVQQMEIRALDPAKHQELINVLKSMDTVTWVGDGVESMARWEPMFGRMLDLLASSTPLARDTTSETGAFRLTVPSMDSVLVIAEASEDDPYFAYKMVGARSNLAFELDMSRGDCDPKRPIFRTAGGRTKDCSRDSTFRTPNVRLWALDAAANKEMLSHLVKTDPSRFAGGDPTFDERRRSVYKQLVAFLGSAVPLGVDTSNADGLFQLRFPPTDDVFIVGIGERDGEPHFGYKVFKGQSNASVELDMSGGRCAIEGWLTTFQLSDLGLIFKDDFNRADGPPDSNWEVRGNTAFWSVSGNVLKGKPTNSALQEILVASPNFGVARGEMVVQARIRRVGTAKTTFPEILARHDGEGLNSFRWRVGNSGNASQDEFRQVVGGQTTVLARSSAYNADNRWQQFKLSVRDYSQEGWKDGVKQVELTSRALNGKTGRAGLSTGWLTSTGDYHEYDDFAVYKRNTVTVRGVPPGHVLRVGARSAIEKSGTATVDLGGDLCPRPMLEIWNPRGVVVARLSPVGGIWGGNTYNYYGR